MTIAPWLSSGGVLTLIGAVGAVIRQKMQAAAAEKTTIERERAQLIASLNTATQQTLAIVREELKVQQENSVRFFELLDRNTAALEKLVAAQALQGQDLSAVKTTVAEIKGGLGVRA